MCCLLAPIPFSDREAICSEEVELQLTGPSPLPVCRPVTVDAHCHLPETQEKYGVSTTTQLFAKVGRSEAVSLQYMVSNFVFPYQWAAIPRQISDLHLNVVHTVGIHPHVASDVVHQSTLETLSALVSDPTCCGVGEIGLDYFRHPAEEERSRQKVTLQKCLEIAANAGKPVVIHCRPSAGEHPSNIVQDCLEVMDGTLRSDHWIHIHCFSGGPDQLQLWLKAFPNCLVGVSSLLLSEGPRGPIHQALAGLAPENILLETDSPYLPPPHLRKQANHPWTIMDTAIKVASIWGMTCGMVLEIARVNVCRFYGLQT